MGTTVRMVLEYDGTDFRGWQRQPSVRTVEGVLCDALQRVTGEVPALSAAGRTDAGAHSHGQVVGVALAREWEAERLCTAVDAVLPDDVAVRSAERVREGFHARFDALRRTYRYVVVSRRERSPLLRRYAWQVGDDLDVDAMREAAAMLRGSHDFAAFGRSPRPGGHTVRTVDHVALRRVGALHGRGVAAFVFEVSADAFLYGMMRGLTGALVAVGRGRMTVSDLAAMLADPQPGRRSVTVAPARGLHQWTVTYPAVSAVETPA